MPETLGPSDPRTIKIKKDRASLPVKPLPTPEERQKLEQESAQSVVERFTELGMPGHVNEFGEAVFGMTPNQPQEKPKQLSFGEFDATKPSAKFTSSAFDPERGIMDMHQTYEIKRSDSPFANMKRTEELAQERARRVKSYRRRKTKGALWKNFSKAK